MKNIVLSIMFLILTMPAFAQTGTIVVEISGIEVSKGSVQIGLYNSKDAFPTYGENYKGAFSAANSTGVTHKFSDIPTGTYAIAVWHDVDNDKTMDKNLFGAPTEKYGFSNNKYGKFGPPDFEEVAFVVKDGKEVKLQINLK